MTSNGTSVTLKAGWVQWKLAPVTSNTSFLLSIGYGFACWDIDTQKIDSITVLLLSHYFYFWHTSPWLDKTPVFAQCLQDTHLNLIHVRLSPRILWGFSNEGGKLAEMGYIGSTDWAQTPLHFLSAPYGFTCLKKNVHLWDSRQKYRISCNIHMFCRRTPWDRITLSPNSLPVGRMTTFVM